MKSKLICTCAALTLALSLFAVPRLFAADAEKGTVSSKDKKFVMEAAQGGMMEVKLGEVASNSAENADVKAFGQMMVKDHGAANDELKTLASSKGITLDEKLDEKNQKMVDNLSKKTGAAFDKAYMAAMVKDHNADVKEFKTASEKADDADIKAWAGKTLPTLEAHLDKAKEVNKALSSGGSAKKEGGEAK
jgi:putative membrane protein